jgi:hypothetical protein
MTRDELLESLLIERYNGVSWRGESAQERHAKASRVPEVPDARLAALEAERQHRDDDLLRAKRRRQMADDFKRVNQREASA